MSKIEIGCGQKRHEGYTRIDIDPKWDPDIVGDFRTMSFSELEEIRSHHLLEHFSRLEGIDVLKLWNSWLKKDGILTVEVPDFARICEQFPKDKYWLARHAFGSQEADWAFHRDGWWREKFEEILPQIGFIILEMHNTESRIVRRDEKGNKRSHFLPNLEVIAKKNV
jgi:predicted SAM-dependent methyltransferase